TQHEQVVFKSAPGRTALPSTQRAVPPSPTPYVRTPTRAGARSSCCTPLSIGCHLPSKRRITPSSPAVTASVGDAAATVRSDEVVPVSNGLHPACSRRYVTPPAPTAHADPLAKPTTP